MNPPSQSRLALLHRQQGDGFLALRFVPELEGQFRIEHLRDVVPRRIALLVTALLLIGIVPVLDMLFLAPPAGFARQARFAQFGFMIPALVVAALFTLVPALRRGSEIAALLAAFIVSAGVVYQRHVGAAFGYDVPSELVAVVLTGTAVMAGLRTIYFAPTVLLILGLSAWSEVRAFGATPASYYVILAQSMLGLIAVVGAAMQEYHARAQWLQRNMLEELTLRDPLSGLVNARGLRDVYQRVFATATREHRPLLVIAVDIDHFKAYNDHYGHLAGDDCLRRVANALARQGRRGNDIAARTGGEEFVLVWYDVQPDIAVRLLEELRQDVERLGILHAGIPRPAERSVSGVVTVSVGAVCAVPGPRVIPEALLKLADEQLYLSKQRGRNCVSLQVADDPAQPPPDLPFRPLRPS
jgi:diguanylate cyclase (GGDEF)-like protein